MGFWNICTPLGLENIALKVAWRILCCGSCFVFEACTAVEIWVASLWVVTPCNVVGAMASGAAGFSETSLTTDNTARFHT
jgi:hypothetical protein